MHFLQSINFREIKFKDFIELKQVLQQHFDHKPLVMAEQFCFNYKSQVTEEPTVE